MSIIRRFLSFCFGHACELFKFSGVSMNLSYENPCARCDYKYWYSLTLALTTNIYMTNVSFSSVTSRLYIVAMPDFTSVYVSISTTTTWHT